MADGHEKKSSTTTSTLATGITSVGSEFITAGSNGVDWTADNVDDNGSLRTTQWNITDGSGICPNGFRVPTRDELESETTEYTGTNNTTTGAVKVTTSWYAFRNFLKLPVAGVRDTSSGNMGEVGRTGMIWTTTKNSSDSQYISTLFFNDSTVMKDYSTHQTQGASVRCREN